MSILMIRTPVDSLALSLERFDALGVPNDTESNDRGLLGQSIELGSLGIDRTLRSGCMVNNGRSNQESSDVLVEIHAVMQHSHNLETVISHPTISGNEFKPSFKIIRLEIG